MWKQATENVRVTQLVGPQNEKVDLAVKNGNTIIQDAQDFYHWAKKTKDASSIKFTFLPSEEYKNVALFLS